MGSIAVALCCAVVVLAASQRAHALRPFIAATDAGVVAPGEVEVEAGLGFERRTSGKDNETTVSLPAVSINVGLARHVELDVGGGYDLASGRKNDGKRKILGTPQETSLTSKIRLFDGRAVLPSLATEFTLVLPTQRKELLPAGRRSVAFRSVAIGTLEVGALKYHLNLGGGVAKDSRRAKTTVGLLLWAVAGEVTITDHLGLVAEVRGEASQQALPENTALGGLVWTSPWGMKLDIAGFGGLSRGSANGGWTLGLTVPFRFTP